MTSPFVDRVEFQVIGRDQGASRVFRNVANEADRAGNEIAALGGDFNRLSSDIDGASARMRAMLLALRAISNVDLPDLALGDVDTGNLAEIDELFAEMAAEIERSNRATTALRGNLAEVEGSGAVAGIASDFRGLAGDVDGAGTSIARFRDELDRIDDGNVLSGLSEQFRNSGRLPSPQGGDVIDGEVVEESVRRTVTTVRSNRDRFESAGLIAGGAIGAGIIAGLSNALTANVGGIISGIADEFPALALAATPGVLAAGAALGTTFAAGLGGAVLGGLGVGGVIGGLVMAAKNAEVKKAAAQTGVVIMDQLLQATAKFPPAVIDALSIVRTEVAALGPELKSFFDSASTFVRPLTEGLMGAFRNLLPGLTEAMRDMQPVINELAMWLPRLGQLAGEIFRRFSDEGPAMARALGITIGLFAELAKAMAGVILIAANLFKTLDIGFSILSGDLVKAAEKFRYYSSEQDKAVADGPEAKAGMDQVRDAFGGVGKFAKIAAGELNTFRQAQVDAMNVANAQINAGNAVASMYDAIRRSSEIAKNKGIDPATQAGADNWRVLSDMAAAANNAAIQMDKNGASHAEVALHTDRAKAAFLRAAEAAGVEEGQAIDLMNALFGIPNVERNVAVNTTEAEANVRHIRKAIKDVTGKTVYINVIRRDSGPSAGEYIPGQGLIPKDRLGGPIYGQGPKGVDSELRMLAPGEHVLTAREVDAAGGHSAVFALRRQLLNGADPAANRRRRRESTATAGAESGSVVQASNMDGRFAMALRKALSGMTLVIDDRTARTAQLIARGG